MDLTSELYDSTGVDSDAIGDTIDVTEEELAFEQPYDTSDLDVDFVDEISGGPPLLARAGLVGAACLATMAVAAGARGRRVVEPLEILGRSVPFLRPRKSLRPVVGLGVLFGGALVLSGVGRVLASIVGGRASALLVPAVAYFVDRNVMGGRLVPRLGRALGPFGLLAKYGTFGLAPLLR